jgi:hypothetical protein
MEDDINSEQTNVKETAPRFATTEMVEGNGKPVAEEEEEEDATFNDTGGNEFYSGAPPGTIAPQKHRSLDELPERDLERIKWGKLIPDSVVEKGQQSNALAYTNVHIVSTQFFAHVKLHGWEDSKKKFFRQEETEAEAGKASPFAEVLVVSIHNEEEAHYCHFIRDSRDVGLEKACWHLFDSLRYRDKRIDLFCWLSEMTDLVLPTQVVDIVNTSQQPRRSLVCGSMVILATNQYLRGTAEMEMSEANTYGIRFMAVVSLENVARTALGITKAIAKEDGIDASTFNRHYLTVANSMDTLLEVSALPNTDTPLQTASVLVGSQATSSASTKHTPRRSKPKKGGLSGNSPDPLSDTPQCNETKRSNILRKKRVRQGDVSAPSKAEVAEAEEATMEEKKAKRILDTSNEEKSDRDDEEEEKLDLSVSSGMQQVVLGRTRHEWLEAGCDDASLERLMEMKGRWPAETNGARKYLKQVCVVGRGCSHWVMSHK